MNEHFTSPKLDTYLSLCTEVYDLSNPTPPKDAYLFYRNYVKAAKGAILEPMCGTGRFLIPLLEEGFNVHGFDASPHMLAKLREKAKAKNLRPNVWHGFTQDPMPLEKYDLIFIPSGSFCLVTDEVEVRTTLRNFYNYLIDGGILLFEVETMKTVSGIGSWQSSTWPTPDETAIRLSQLAQFNAGIHQILGKYELISNNKIIHRETETYNIRIYEQDTLIAALRSTGFKEIRLVKAFDNHQNPSQDDESIVYECKK
jgi:SAM-dependent methyltransferase